MVSGTFALLDDLEFDLFAAHLEDVVGAPLLLGFVGIPPRRLSRRRLRPRLRKVDKIGRAFERPRARTGNQHRHLTAFAGV